MFRNAPALRPGETLYSVLARFGRLLRATEAGPFMRGLLGRRHAIASIDLPGNLAALAHEFASDGVDQGIAEVIDRLTGFPFHTAFVPPSVRAEVRRAMEGDVTGIYTRLGLARFKVRPTTHLRFCPACLDEMEAERGDGWWRREHQIPGISVCALHGIPLRLSDVDPSDLNRHTFVPAGRDVCRPDAPAAIDGADEPDLRRLADLAVRAAALLDGPPPAREFGEIMGGYRTRLAVVGLMRSPKKVDHVALLAAFKRRWGEVADLIPGLELDEDPERSWLAGLVRNDRRAAHPLQHLMLGAVLDEADVVPREQPFGTGPWPCRNPVAPHHGEQVIDTVGIRRDRGDTYGDFACSCGYLYTIGITADGMIGRPRYRRFGPLFVPALKAALKRKAKLRPTAAALGLDPKTLMREAAMAGIAVPWSLTASGAIPVMKDAPVPAKAPARRPPARPVRNWFAIDTRLARSAKAVVSEISALRPPVRVTFAEVERRIARGDWILKRKRKLPQTVAAIAVATERTDAFRHRRLRWCVAQAFQADDLRPCEILRAAGLPMDWMPKVRHALAMIQIRGREAA